MTTIIRSGVAVAAALASLFKPQPLMAPLSPAPNPPPRSHSLLPPLLASHQPRPLQLTSAVAVPASPSGADDSGLAPRRPVGMQTTSSSSNLVVVSFYKFADLPDYAELRQPLKDLCCELRISGGIILAPEGINGSLCGSREALREVMESIQADKRLANIRQTESPAGIEEEEIHHGHTKKSPLGAGPDAPFRWDHVRVKLKKEVVSLGVPGVSPTKVVGKYVNPRDWNALLQDPYTMVVDVRNTYETRIGKFKGAVDPQTTSFREFPMWVEENLLRQQSSATYGVQDSRINQFSRADELERTGDLGPLPHRIAMYCTGGIRCEKATSFLMSKGFTEVYHLKGGILKYLEEIPSTESLWDGECFVFDKRVSVEHGLKQGTHHLCYACKKPVNDEDMRSAQWEYGISCPYCCLSKSGEEKARARARQQQFEMWEVIGGPDKGRSPVSPQKNQNFKRTCKQYLSKSL